MLASHAHNYCKGVGFKKLQLTLGNGLLISVGCPVAAVLPHAEEVMMLASGGSFALRYPNHPLTALYQQVASTVLAEPGSGS